MADSLNTNPIDVDLTDVADRVLKTIRTPVVRVVVNGPTPVGATTITLRTRSVTGPIVWSYNNTVGGSAQLHTQDDIACWADEGLYFANDTNNAWGGGARILVYTS